MISSQLSLYSVCILYSVIRAYCCDDENVRRLLILCLMLCRHHRTVCRAAEQPPQQMSPARNLLGPALGPLHTNMMELSRGEHGRHLLSAQLGPFPGDNIISQISLQPVVFSLVSVNSLQTVDQLWFYLHQNKVIH